MGTANCGHWECRGQNVATLIPKNKKSESWVTIQQRYGPTLAPLVCVHAGPAIAIGRRADDYTHPRLCGAWAGVSRLRLGAHFSLVLRAMTNEED